MTSRLALLQGGAGRDGFGPDALSEQHGSDLDVFGRKLAGIIMADYTQLALSAGPLDIAGQVGVHSNWSGTETCLCNCNFTLQGVQGEDFQPSLSCCFPGSHPRLRQATFVYCAKPLRAPLQIPQLPNPPPDVERNPTLLAEYESIAGQIKSSCHQVALLDRVHNIKVWLTQICQPRHAASCDLWCDGSPCRSENL
jgi:hypothetical protein